MDDVYRVVGCCTVQLVTHTDTYCLNLRHCVHGDDKLVLLVDVDGTLILVDRLYHESVLVADSSWVCQAADLELDRGTARRTACAKYLFGALNADEGQVVKLVDACLASHSELGSTTDQKAMLQHFLDVGYLHSIIEA